MLDRIAMITGNAGKAAEYAAMLGIEVTPAKAELTEIQSLDVADVAARKAADAFGPQGILAMAAGLTDRRATVSTALGYASADGVRVFQGTVNGTLATEPR